MKHVKFLQIYPKVLATLELLTKKESLSVEENRVLQVCLALVDGSKDLLNLFEKEVIKAGITFHNENSENSATQSREEALGAAYGTALGFPEAFGMQSVSEISPEVEKQQIADFHSMLSCVTEE